MNLLRNIIKFLQVVTLLYVPIIIVYWLLLQVSLPQLANLQATLGILSLPFVDFTRLFFDLRFQMDKGQADFTPLITAISMFGMFFVYQVFDGFIEKSQLRAENRKKQKALHEQEMKIKNEKLKELQELSKHKVIYLTVKYKAQESSISYLANFDDEEESEAKVEVFIKDLFDCVKNFNGKIVEKNKKEGIHGIVFYNIEESLDFILYLNNRFFDFNSEFIKMGSKLVYNGAYNCYISEELIESDITAMNNLLNLCAENDVIVTDVFKRKYEVLKEKSNISFHTRGTYSVINNHIEIYQMAVSKV